MSRYVNMDAVARIAHMGCGNATGAITSRRTGPTGDGQDVIDELLTWSNAREQVRIEAAVATERARASDKLDRLAAAVEKLVGGVPPSAKWITTAQVAKKYNMSADTLFRIVDDAKEAGFKPLPWIVKGRGTKRRVLSWDPEQTDTFMERLNTWRTSESKSGRVSTKSGGGTRKGGNGSGSARRSATRSPSSSPSKAPEAKGATGSLRSRALRHYSET